MASFEDDLNPFGEAAQEQAPQQVDPPEEASVAPPTPAKTAAPAPAPPAYRGYPGLKPKEGFCCVRDEYLHSDDAEIQVSYAIAIYSPADLHVDCRRAQDDRPHGQDLYCICNSYWCTYSPLGLIRQAN